MTVSDACTLNISNDASSSVKDASRTIIDDSRVILHIVVSLYDLHDNRNMFVVQGTVLSTGKYQGHNFTIKISLGPFESL